MKKFLTKIKKYRKSLILAFGFLRVFDILFKTKKNIKDLNENLEKRNSFKRAFLRGLVTGVARVVGATIIAAILITILAKFLSAVDLPFIDNLLEKANIEIFSQDKNKNN